MLALVDTSVWVQHLHRGDAKLAALLRDRRVMIHPWVIGELACGGLSKRDQTLDLLVRLPAVTVAQHEEVMRLIEVRRLMGIGLGYIDVHLIASSLLDGVPLLTYDKNLSAGARALGVAYQ